MSALPKLEPEEDPETSAFRTPEAELSPLDHLDRISRKCQAETVLGDVEAVRAYLAVHAVDAEIRKAERAARFESARRLGLRTLSRNAEEMRQDWEIYVLDLLRQSTVHITRAQIIEGIKARCMLRRFKGKNGFSIQRSTIVYWFTTKKEQELRNAALAIR